MMNRIDVNPSNLPMWVEEALQVVRGRLDKIDSASIEGRDLEVALESLSLVQAELTTGNARPRDQRSAGFTRYVIDEEPNLKIDPDLRDLIVQIESIYKRY